MLEWADISQDHAVPANVEAMPILGMRACLGASFVDRDFAAQYAEATRRNPDIVTLDYIFLSGPLRYQPIASQMAFYMACRKAELSCLDWEQDVYKVRVGTDWQTVDKGIQPFSAVLAGVRTLQQKGLDPGVYASLSKFSSDVVGALIKAGVPYLWVAAYGVSIPQWLIDWCRVTGTLLFHQYTGDSLDRSRVLVGTLDDIRRLAGKPTQEPPVAKPAGERMMNLVPMTCHRVVDIKPDADGTVLWADTAESAKFTTLFKPVTLGYISAAPTHFYVADGDRGVYVRRSDVAAVRTADINVGA